MYNRAIWKNTMNLAAELERLAQDLAGDAATSAPLSWASVAQSIAKSLGVKPDEVGILGVSARWRHLYFLAPEALKNVGYIPMSSNSALAARTARESRPEINNNFPATRHATVFEGLKIGGDSAEVIQKIISAPILDGDKVIGVIQISRKGANATVAGPDFTAANLGKVLAICKPLGKLLQRVSSD
jgi:hypothetical protein